MAAAAFLSSIIFCPPSEYSVCAQLALHTHPQPEFGASAEEVVAALRRSYARWTPTPYGLCPPARCSHPCRRAPQPTSRPGSAPPGCSLGVRVTDDDVVLVVPVGESLQEYERRTGRLFPRLADRTSRLAGRIVSPGIVANYADIAPGLKAFNNIYAADHVVAGFEVSFLPEEFTPAEYYEGFETGRLYSEGELVQLLKRTARFGFVWCEYDAAADDGDAGDDGNDDDGNDDDGDLFDGGIAPWRAVPAAIRSH